MNTPLEDTTKQQNELRNETVFFLSALGLSQFHLAFWLQLHFSYRVNLQGKLHAVELSALKMNVCAVYMIGIKNLIDYIPFETRKLEKGFGHFQNILQLIGCVTS